jgi:predicted acyltransferase
MPDRVAGGEGSRQQAGPVPAIGDHDPVLEPAGDPRAAASPSRRLDSLDVLRGLTVAAMLLVNNPGRWSDAAIYPPLRHADWNGLTPTDLIFPFFLFIVGVSLVFSFAGRTAAGRGRGELWRHVLRRALILVGLGLVLNLVPVLARPGGDLAAALGGWRLPGVLQRIGACYLLAATVYLWRPRRGWLLGIALALVVGTSAWMRHAPLPGGGAPDLALDLAAQRAAPATATNWGAWLDTRLLGRHALLNVEDPQTGRTVWAFDPEGTASTPAALATVLLGVVCGLWLAPRRGRTRELVGGLAATGGGLVALSVPAAIWIPLNKQLWTGSYVLATAGAACLTLAACQIALARGGRALWAAPCRWYGRNAILAFFGSGLLARLLVLVRVPAGSGAGETTALKTWLFEHLFAAWAPLRPASLLYALSVVALWAAVAGVLHRRRWYWKI